MRIGRERAGQYIGAVILVSAMTGCASTPKDSGRKELITGSFLSDVEMSRVADLMARDLVRNGEMLHTGAAPRIAFVKVENDTNQYFFQKGRSAYLERMRTQLQQALKERVKFVDEKVEQRLREELAGWHLDEEGQDSLVRGKGADQDVDYLLGATFSSLDKVVQVADKRGRLNNRDVVELQMTFYLVDAKSAEIAWQNDVVSAASYSTRDFQN
ncbi:MAG: hypothetical protein J5J06_09365 [Phycisphaerae bacterium]|nr:hypothetical protein [Phycisphaerae bacterium]